MSSPRLPTRSAVAVTALVVAVTAAAAVTQVYAHTGRWAPLLWALAAAAASGSAVAVAAACGRRDPLGPAIPPAPGDRYPVRFRSLVAALRALSPEDTHRLTTAWETILSYPAYLAATDRLRDAVLASHWMADFDTDRPDGLDKYLEEACWRSPGAVDAVMWALVDGRVGLNDAALLLLPARTAGLLPPDAARPAGGAVVPLADRREASQSVTVRRSPSPRRRRSVPGGRRAG